ncbi:MAG: TolC family protein, partial [Nitrospira sp.]|nr:TolC family protein [Nitrospira sp.]
MRPAIGCGIIAAFACAAISCSYLTGHAAELSSSGYTLGQVIQLAIQHNPKMKGAEAVLEQSQSQRVTAGAFLNPTIMGSAGPGWIRDPSTGVSIIERTVTVQQPLEWLDKRAARQRAADAGIGGALAGLDQTRVSIMADTKGAFFQLLFAQQDAWLARENLKTVEDL